MAQTFPDHMKVVDGRHLVVHRMIGSLEKHGQTTTKPNWLLTEGGRFAALRPCCECVGTLPIGIVVVTPQFDLGKNHTIY